MTRNERTNAHKWIMEEKKKNLWFAKHRLFLQAKKKKKNTQIDYNPDCQVLLFSFSSSENWHFGMMKAKDLKMMMPHSYSWYCVCAQSCLILWDPMDCSPPGFSVYGIFQARILELVTISYSRGSSWPRDRIHVSCVSCIAGGFFTTEPSGKPDS